MDEKNEQRGGAPVNENRSETINRYHQKFLGHFIEGTN